MNRRRPLSVFLVHASLPLLGVFFLPFFWLVGTRLKADAEWSLLMAASTLMTVPIIGIFFFAQRTFIQGITLTGVKG